MVCWVAGSTHLWVAHERVDRGVVDDGPAPRHDGDQVFGEVEERVDVDVEDVAPLLVREVFDVRDFVLRRVVVDPGE